MEYTGRLIVIGQPQEGVSKSTGKSWKSLEIVLEDTTSQYPRKASFKIFGIEKVDEFLQKYRANDNLKISFDIDSQEYQGRWFTKLNAWKIEQADAAPASPAVPPIDYAQAASQYAAAQQPQFQQPVQQGNAMAQGTQQYGGQPNLGGGFQTPVGGGAAGWQNNPMPGYQQPIQPQQDGKLPF